MSKIFDFVQSFNVDIDDFVVKDVGEKIGSLFGEEGRRIGKAIDDATKDITIKIANDEDE